MEAIIREYDRAFDIKLETIAEDILSKKDIRLVRLSGPTCSGKTTAAAMLVRTFEKAGKRAITVSIDDFYFDTNILKSNSKKKGVDGIDYDSVDTIDLDDLSRFVEEIFDSDEVHCPIFDFLSGRRTGYRAIKIGKDDIFIFEGIQALYPEITALFSKHSSAGIFIAPMTDIITEDKKITPNELRLMRRLVRDYKYRNTDPRFTFDLWKNVRENEERAIFPFVDTCEYKVDSTMPYELGVLRPYLEDILKDVKKEEPCYAKAKEILSSIKNVEFISDTLIGADSLYKEFV
jgi:uridine kinase